MPCLSSVVDVLGTNSFGEQLLQFFQEAIGADYFSAYRMQNYVLSKVISASTKCIDVPDEYTGTYDINRKFRHFSSTCTKVELYNPGSILGDASSDSQYPQGILILGSKFDSQYCARILILRDRPSLSGDELAALHEVADLLLSSVARHHELSVAKPNPFTALTSLEVIEDRILDTQALSKREAQVCARILGGFSTCSIATDLGIGKESVMTYRKRAYQHLGIGSQRELLLWYLEQAPLAMCN